MKLYIITLLWVLVLINSTNGQNVSIATSDKNPFVHSFSLHNIPSLQSKEYSDSKPFYEVTTLFGDGQFSKDSIFPGPRMNFDFPFSSPINFTSHLYPSSSNYPFIILLKAINASLQDEILTKGLTIPNQLLNEDFGMCNPISKESINKDKEIVLLTINSISNDSKYVILLISFLTHNKPSKINLSYDKADYEHSGQIIPNIVGAISLNNNSTFNKLDSLSKVQIIYDIKTIPRISKDEPFEIRIAEIFKIKNKNLGKFKVEYQQKDSYVLDTDMLIPNQNNYWHSENISNMNEVDKMTKEINSPQSKRFSEISIFTLLANYWSVVLMAIFTFVLLWFLIKKFKPKY